MKLLRQTTLILEQGQTEKIYEVDLCEVGRDKYVVNFRFGIKGGTTKEGSKTVVPVPLVDAEKIFDKLVSSNQNKGFYDANDPRPSAVPTPPVATASTTGSRFGSGSTPAKKGRLSVDAAAREAAILERLTKKTRWSLSRKGKAWPLSRAVWRAGELRLKSAALPIAALLDDKNADAMLRYSACWALGRIGENSAAPALQKILGADLGPRHVSRMAAIALFNLADGNQREHMADAVLSELPAQLAGPARTT
ncbi:MAG: hypothetical protein GY822_08165 [Deltaproteobacteria bacterium]|nr:hypothetical protein [Deltaproteobacteria bacterium]